MLTENQIRVMAALDKPSGNSQKTAQQHRWSVLYDLSGAQEVVISALYGTPSTYKTSEGYNVAWRDILTMQNAGLVLVLHTSGTVETAESLSITPAGLEAVRLFGCEIAPYSHPGKSRLHLKWTQVKTRHTAEIPYDEISIVIEARRIPDRTNDLGYRYAWGVYMEDRANRVLEAWNLGPEDYEDVLFNDPDAAKVWAEIKYTEYLDLVIVLRFQKLFPDRRLSLLQSRIQPTSGMDRPIEVCVTKTEPAGGANFVMRWTAMRMLLEKSGLKRTGQFFEGGILKSQTWQQDIFEQVSPQVESIISELRSRMDALASALEDSRSLLAQLEEVLRNDKQS